MCIFHRFSSFFPCIGQKKLQKRLQKVARSCKKGSNNDFEQQTMFGAPAWLVKIHNHPPSLPPPPLELFIHFYRSWVFIFFTKC